jgi:hypothetical protein
LKKAEAEAQAARDAENAGDSTNGAESAVPEIDLKTN